MRLGVWCSDEQRGSLNVGVRAALVSFVVGLLIVIVGLVLVVGGAIPKRHSALIITIAALCGMYAIGVYLGIKARKARLRREHSRPV